MTRLTLCVFAAAFLAGGCATVKPTERFWSSPLPKEAFVTGSKMPRSEKFENYQGTKTISRPDYQQYRKPSYGEM